MALIKNLKRGFKDRESIHGITDSSYIIINDKRGQKYLQIDTFGSSERAMPGKISQSIQFSPEAIKQLKEIFSKEF
jgi:hypothetical protein